MKTFVGFIAFVLLCFVIGYIMVPSLLEIAKHGRHSRIILTDAARIVLVNGIFIDASAPEKIDSE